MRKHGILLAMLAPLFFGACGGASDGSSEARTGKMELRLVDAPADEVKEIVVTINKVTAHLGGGGGWQTLANETKTVDLLKLQGGTFAVLGVTEIPAGKITQFRLYVDESGPNYVTTPDGKQVPLKVPSGEQSGIKVKWGDFKLPKCATGQMTIDFDGKKSIHVHPTGHEDQWILRPVVRLKAVSYVEGACPGDDGDDDDKKGGKKNKEGDASAVPPAPETPPAPTPPAPTSCDQVTCAESHFCHNGTCQRLIE